ncbi:MAG: Ig-like domain-containing protein [Candidatus Neomarinimicrobiota bacterium]|nr:Ig-like domain-containing protein [Candidatus Neomarinimicrobiota bacterium]
MNNRSSIYHFIKILFILASTMQLSAENYYVSVSYGNDNNDGKSLSTPFKTIAKAASVMSAGDNCYIREGSYHETIVMNNNDGASGSPIVFTNYNNERVIMDGTIPIDTSWSIHSGNIYKQKLTFRPWQLFADRKEQVMARWPNAKFSDNSIWDNDNYWAKGTIDKDDNAYSNGTIIDDPYTNKDGTNIDLNAKGFDLDESGKEAIAILNVGSFKTWSRKVTSHSGNTFNYSNTPSWKTKHHYYYLEGRLEFLDSAGEWYFDVTDSTLYFWAEDNVHPKNLKIRGKVQSYAFEITASEYIHIKNLEFFATTVYFFNGDNCLIYGANFMYPSCSKRMLRVVDTLPEMTIFKSNSSNSVIRRSAFRNTDGTAVEMWGGNNKIDSTYFNNIDYSVADNSGLMITVRMNGSNNVFSHNTIHKTGASATVSAGIAPLVEYNDLYDTGHLQSDGSMIQITESEQDGAICRYNWLHDTEKYGARFDHSGTADGVNGLMHHNVAWNCLAGGIMAKGNNHKIYNNTVINSGSRNDIIILKVGDSDHSGTILKNNVAGKIANHRSNDVEIDFGTYSNNWNGYKESASITTVLTDTSTKDFTPKSGSAIIDAGAVISGITDGYQGSAPDMGAFESGKINWTAGHGWDVNDTFGSSWVELDEAYPTITSVSINSDNNEISVTFSEAVYNSIESPSSLEKSDFALSLSGGVATLSSATPTSISKSGNVYTLGFGLSGTPDGNEVLKVVPVDDGIYDAVGNEASTVQNNNTKNLNDQTKPVIGLIKFAKNNSFLDIKFSVGVYSSSNGSGAIETSDFSLVLLKNNGTLDNASIKSVKKDDNDNESSASSLSGGEQTVRIFLNLSGTANGSETISINPIDGNSIFDLAGNAAEAIQSNNSANLNDLIPPTVTFNPGDNSTGIPLNSSITLTFSEAIRKIDDSEINNNNVSTLLVLKENDANGSEISFDATINTNRTLIIIDPLNDFSFSQKIYVAIGGVEDNGGNKISNSSSIIFTVVSNVVPTANKQTITLDEDTVANILLTGNDKESSDLKYSYSLPIFGSLSGTAPNLVYKPNPNFFGPDSFKFVVNDGVIDSDSALVSIIVNSINDKPSDFDLISPVDQFEIRITNNNVDNAKVSFSWHESIDIDMDKLNYIFHYQFEMNNNNDEKFQLDYDTTINETSVDFIYRNFLKKLDSSLSTRGQITWSVDVTDGIDTVINNEQRIIKVEGKYAALSTNEDKVFPEKYILYQNYPNPFNPITSIKYDLPRETPVTIEIYNIIGNKITTLIDKNMDAGSHIVRWNSTDNNGAKIPSCIYFYHIKTNEFIKTKKMILLK